MSLPEEDAVAGNLLRFLQDNLKEGQDAEVAVHPELRRVLVFVDGELVLSCSFDDLISGPGASLN